jgi:NTP pyrophosphatase (non-canonical NTP hydrolase)
MKKYEKEIRNYLNERGWTNLKPADLAKSISIEASELLEIFQWSDETLVETKKNKEKIEIIKKELADVLIYCLDMSVLLGLDTGKIIIEKLNLVKKKYPTDLINKNNGDKLYLKIKNEHRANRKKL